MTRSLSTREAARIVGLSESQVRSLLRSTLLRSQGERPERSGRRYALSFQDLVVLKTARELIERRIPSARIRRALRALAAELPESRPLSGLRIFADGTQVAVSDGERTWNPETGQILFAFEVDALARCVLASRGSAEGVPSDARGRATRTFEHGLEVETRCPEEAARAYRDALEIDPDLVDAYVNLGRLEHERGEVLRAVSLYEAALARSPADAVIHFNLALAFEDLSGPGPAAAHYEQAIELDPEFADAHFNLARVCEGLGRAEDALRHYHAYKKLTEP